MPFREDRLSYNPFMLSVTLLAVMCVHKRHISSALTLPAAPVTMLPISPSVSILGPISLGLLSTSSTIFPDLEDDQVVRVLDANTIKLQNHGIVTLAGVRMPTPGSGNFQFPECLTYTPAYKVRQLLPANEHVLVKVARPTSVGKSSQAVVVRRDDFMVVNQELVRSGFGRVQNVANDDLSRYLDADRMQTFQDRAKQEGIGIFQRCDGHEGQTFEAQFEPLELTMETQWGDDGGTVVVRQKDTTPFTPSNPGDVKGT
jgi:hypothetical protein